MYFVNCGTKMNEKSNFCHECGAKLGQVLDNDSSALSPFYLSKHLLVQTNQVVTDTGHELFNYSGETVWVRLASGINGNMANRDVTRIRGNQRVIDVGAPQGSKWL